MSFAVEVSNLIKTFKVPGSQHIEVLKGIDLKVKRGEFLSIMGPSGSGKSTLLNILASLESYTDGRVAIAGNEISKTDEKNLLRIRRTTTSIVFQDFNLLPYLSAIENVMLPMLLTGNKEEAARERAADLLAKVGIADRAAHIPDDLSGGQKQRVSLARALANNPTVLLADEPTGNLDSKTGDVIIELLRELAKNDQVTVIMVTHNVRQAKKADRILILRGGTLHREEENLGEL